MNKPISVEELSNSIFKFQDNRIRAEVDDFEKRTNTLIKEINNKIIIFYSQLGKTLDDICIVELGDFNSEFIYNEVLLNNIADHYFNEGWNVKYKHCKDRYENIIYIHLSKHPFKENYFLKKLFGWKYRNH